MNVVIAAALGGLLGIGVLALADADIRSAPPYVRFAIPLFFVIVAAALAALW
jgi:hypothetical protein